MAHQSADKASSLPRLHADSADSEASSGTDFDTPEQRPNSAVHLRTNVAGSDLLRRL